MPWTPESTRAAREAFLAKFRGDPVALSAHMRELSKERARYIALGKKFMEALEVIGYPPKEGADRLDNWIQERPNPPKLSGAGGLQRSSRKREYTREGDGNDSG